LGIAMRVTDIRVIPSAEYCQLEGRVESDRNDGDVFSPFVLWYRFPLWCQAFLCEENGDPFLAALLVPAMTLGEDLSIPVPVSPSLLRNLQDIQSIHTRFDPWLKRVSIAAPPRLTSSPHELATATGLFFSLGVDSFYSLFKNMRDHPHDPESVTHLLAMHGFDVCYGEWGSRFPPEIVRNSERVAQETGKELLPVTTNVRQVTEPLSRWNMSHGAALASIALALDGLFSRVLIAASTTYDQLYPWGSHPVLDPLWSTDRLNVVHDGCEMGRIDKVAFVAGSPLVLETLRVCPGYSADYNCGQCVKCLPTMIDLLQLGVLERCATFPHTIDVELLSRTLEAYRGNLNVENYARRLADLEAADGPLSLRKAIADYLASEAAPAVELPAPSRSRRAPFWKLLPRRQNGVPRR
jgi:hypothetical protein